MYIGGVIALTLIRDWPWTHTVFFVLHGIVMLMKQHSYSFYNGYLSTAYKKRKCLLSKLKQLELIASSKSPSTNSPSAIPPSVSYLAQQPPSAAKIRERRQPVNVIRRPEVSDLDRISDSIECGEPLDADQARVFERIIRWEIDSLTEELRGKATSVIRAYPKNLTLANHYEYIVLPTVVYELEYPRSVSIDWYYVAEKTVATVGIIFVMIMVSQAFICRQYP